MTLKVQLIIGFVLLVAFIAIVNMIRNKKLELKYALLWLSIIAALVILDIFPWIMDSMSVVLGISSPVNMIFFMGFCFSLVVIFILTVAVARMSERLRQLTQAVALMGDKEQLQKIIKETTASGSGAGSMNIEINGNETLSSEPDKNRISE